MLGARDYRIEFEEHRGGRWRKDGALCVAKTTGGAIRRFRQRGGKGLRMRNIKAKRLNTYYGHELKG